MTAIAEDENLQIRKEDREGLFLEIWSFTAHCNWLDIVDIRFREGKDSSGKFYILRLSYVVISTVKLYNNIITLQC